MQSRDLSTGTMHTLRNGVIVEVVERPGTPWMAAPEGYFYGRAIYTPNEWAHFLGEVLRISHDELLEKTGGTTACPNPQWVYTAGITSIYADCSVCGKRQEDHSK